MQFAHPSCYLTSIFKGISRNTWLHGSLKGLLTRTYIKQEIKYVCQGKVHLSWATRFHTYLEGKSTFTGKGKLKMMKYKDISKIITLIMSLSSMLRNAIIISLLCELKIGTNAEV